MREFIIKFDTDKPLSELASGTNLRAMMKVTGDCDEIIRCKDCKCFERRSIYHHGLCDIHCNGIGEKEVTSEDQYCSWAERKEE